MTSPQLAPKSLSGGVWEYAIVAIKLIVVWGVVALAAAVAAALLASWRNRDHSAWAAWSFLFPPLVLVLLFLPRNAGPRPRRRSIDEEDHEHA